MCARPEPARREEAPPQTPSLALAESRFTRATREIHDLYGPSEAATMIESLIRLARSTQPSLPTRADAG